MPNIVVNGTILLKPDMVWEDEFNWSPVGVKEEVSLTGASIIQTSIRQNGRRITLKSTQETAWVTRAQLDALRLLEASLEPFSLTLGNGTAFTVMFDSTSSTAIAAEPIQPGKEPAPGDFFIATLRFMEVSE